MFYLLEAAPTGSASDTLAASIIAGLVTIIVTLIGVFATRVKSQHNASSAARGTGNDNPQHETIREEIIDLKRQRDTLQRKFDRSERENERLRNLLWRNLINPDSGERT